MLGLASLGAGLRAFDLHLEALVDGGRVFNSHLAGVSGADVIDATDRVLAGGRRPYRGVVATGGVAAVALSVGSRVHVARQRR